MPRPKAADDVSVDYEPTDFEDQEVQDADDA